MRQNSTEYKLQKILEKCISEERQIDFCLNESRISYLISEAIDESDIAAVRKEIEKSREEVKTLRAYLGKLELNPSLMSSTASYVDALDSALNDAQGDLASASFDTGATSSFFGQKWTLPNLTLGAISLHKKANGFLSGIKTAIGNIQNQLDPLIKDDRDEPLSSVAGKNGVPDLKKMTSGIAMAFSRAIGGGGWWQKLKNWADEPASNAVLKKLPEIDADEMGKSLAQALMEKSINSIMGVKVPPPEDPKDSPLDEIGNEADADTDAESSGGGEDPDGEKKGDDAPTGTPKEQAAAVKTAVKDAEKESVSPLDAALDALKTWSTSLPASSQKMLKMKNRMGELEDGIKTGLENSKTAIEGEIREAIQEWLNKHEEALSRSKKFSKKSLDSLTNMIPRLAVHMLQKTDESGRRLTKNDVHKFTHRYLNKKFRNELRSNVLFEALISPKGTKRDVAAEEDETMDRWKELAGIKS